MKSRKILIAICCILVCLLGISLWMNYTTYFRDDMFAKLLSEKNVILSQNVVEAILSDMKQGGEAKAERWRVYLKSRAGFDNGYVLATTGTLQHTLAQYEANEKPSRSNYFNLLIWSLRTEHATHPLTKQVLLTYLGNPDADVSRSGGTILQYQYWVQEKKYLASIAISNEMVSRFDIYVE